MQYRQVPAWLAAICLAASTAACSSSGKPEISSAPLSSPTQSATAPVLSTAGYRQALHQVAVEENDAQHKVEKAFHARAVMQLRRGLSRFATDQRSVARRLRALHPPADAVAANSHLAKAFSDNATAIDAMLTKIDSTKTVQQAMTIIQNDHGAQQIGHEIDTALAALKRLGYTSGS